VPSEKTHGNVLWPDVSTREGCLRAAWTAATLALLVSVARAGWALVDWAAAPVAGATPWAFMDAALFAVIALGLWKLSRVAAIAGLALYVVGHVWRLATTDSWLPAATVFLAIFFAHGVRATFSHAWLLRCARRRGAELQDCLQEEPEGFGGRGPG